MGHHSQVAAVLRGDAGNAAWRAVGVGGVGAIAVLCHHMVAVGSFGEMEFSFTMSHPDAEFAATKVAKHHRVVCRNGEPHKIGFKFVAVVMLHARLAFVFGIEQIEFNHHLATIANA